MEWVTSKVVVAAAAVEVDELGAGVDVAAVVGDGVDVDVFVGGMLPTAFGCWLLQPTRTRNKVSGVKLANRDLGVNNISMITSGISVLAVKVIIPVDKFSKIR